MGKIGKSGSMRTDEACIREILCSWESGSWVRAVDWTLTDGSLELGVWRITGVSSSG